MYGLLTRFTAKASSAVETEVTGNPDPGCRQVVAATLKSRAGHVTLIVVNESYRAAEASVDLTGLASGRFLMRYTATRALRDRALGARDWDRRIPVSGNTARFQDSIPGLSIAVYTTYDIAPDAPGIGAEEH